MFSFIGNQENADQNYKEMSLHTHQVAKNLKVG